MLRRKTSERKAATQALQVIAESIRACRGRGGRPPASSPKLEKLIAPCLQRSRSDIVRESHHDVGKNHKTTPNMPVKNIITRRDSLLSMDSIGSQTRSKAVLNKENLKPNQELNNGLTKKRSLIQNDTKIAVMSSHVDQSAPLKSVLKPSLLDEDPAKASFAMCPPEPIQRKNRKKLLSSQQTHSTQQLGVSEDQNSKYKERLKVSGQQLEMVLQLKKSQSLFDPVLNPEKITPANDMMMSQASLLSDAALIPIQSG